MRGDPTMMETVADHKAHESFLLDAQDVQAKLTAATTAFRTKLAAAKGDDSTRMAALAAKLGLNPPAGRGGRGGRGGGGPAAALADTWPVERQRRAARWATTTERSAKGDSGASQGSAERVEGTGANAVTSATSLDVIPHSGIPEDSMKRIFVALAAVVLHGRDCARHHAHHHGRLRSGSGAARAESLTGLTFGGAVPANSLPDERFWYRNTTATGTQIVLVDPAKKSRVVCDAQRTNCPGVPADTAAPAGGRGGRGGGGAPGAGRGAAQVLSPDGKRAAFIREWNLYVRDVATGQKKLTTDGEVNNGYATDNAGWASSDRPMILWSPDSKKIATQQQDERKVGDMFLVETKVGHPVLKAWKYPLPGDSVVAMLSRVMPAG